jgi:hypothetical protein
VKPFDCCVIVESILVHARMQSDVDALIAIAFAAFYVRFFGGRTHELRGDA